MKSILIVASLLISSLVYGQTAEEYYDRAVTKFNLQDYIGSIADFNKAIELDPNYADAYCARGLSKYSLQDYRGAIVDFNKAIKINPYHAEAYFARGLVKTFLDQIDDGCMDLSKAGELGYSQAYEAIQKICN